MWHRPTPGAPCGIASRTDFRAIASPPPALQVQSTPRRNRRSAQGLDGCVEQVAGAALRPDEARRDGSTSTLRRRRRICTSIRAVRPRRCAAGTGPAVDRERKYALRCRQESRREAELRHWSGGTNRPCGSFRRRSPRLSSPSGEAEGAQTAPSHRPPRGLCLGSAQQRRRRASSSRLEKGRSGSRRHPVPAPSRGPPPRERPVSIRMGNRRRSRRRRAITIPSSPLSRTSRITASTTSRASSASSSRWVATADTRISFSPR